MKMEKCLKRMAVLLTLIMVLSMAVSGCGNRQSDGAGGVSGQAEQSEDKGRSKYDIILGTNNDIRSLDPHNTNDMASAAALIHIYSTLVTVNNDGELVGDLAESWEQTSDRDWKFKLHEGVKFHDGTELKASDVKFSIEREKDSPQVQYLVEKIDTVEVVDDYTFVFHLSEPYSALLGNLVHEGSSILSEKAVTAAGDKYKDHPIGTGPLKYVEWVPNNRLVMEKFVDYFGGPYFKEPGKAERITFKVIPEGTSRTIALETGEVDFVQKLESADIKRIEENPDLKTMERVSISVEQLGFNVEMAPFDNLLVRQAISHAVNKQAIIDVVLEGRGQVLNSLMGRGIPGFNENVKGYDYDVERARELMKEANFEDGFTVKLVANGDLRNRTAQLIQSDLSQIGINVEIELLEYGAYLDAVNTGKYPMHIAGWTNGTFDGDGSLNPLYNSANKGASGNRSFYSNPTVDKMLLNAATEMDRDKRLKLYGDIQQILSDDAVAVPLYSSNEVVAMRKGLQGFTLQPVSAHRFENLHYE